MEDQLNKEQAIAFAESNAWEPLTLRQRAEFQMEQPLMCMPFSVFHEAVEKTLGRPVYTHEFINADSLRQEMRGDKPAPTLDEIMNLIPVEKRVVILVA